MKNPLRKTGVELSREANEAYQLLKASEDRHDKQLLKAIDRILDTLKENLQFGDPIPKALIPKSYLEMGISNLWCVDLPGYWRLLYTIRGDKLEVIAFILEWMDHKKYDRLFGYQKK